MPIFQSRLFEQTTIYEGEKRPAPKYSCAPSPLANNRFPAVSDRGDHDYTPQSRGMNKCTDLPTAKVSSQIITYHHHVILKVRQVSHSFPPQNTSMKFLPRGYAKRQTPSLFFRDYSMIIFGRFVIHRVIQMSCF